MVRGIESFREWFSEYSEQYVIIGGTACDLLMSDEGLNFRATKDIDLVLVIEALDANFGRRFWEYISIAGYEYRNKSTGEPQFYRFSNPKSNDYPSMIEIFTRKPNIIELPQNAVLSPLPMEDDISSLSAILLDDDYYEFLKKGRIKISEVTILDAPFLIPFKAKAWIDLSNKRASGSPIDSRNIRKHKNDIFRLSQLLNVGLKMTDILPDSVKEDMKVFIGEMAFEDIDLTQIGVFGKTKDSILADLSLIYL